MPATDRHTLIVMPILGSKRLKAHNLIQLETAFPSQPQIRSSIDTDGNENPAARSQGGGSTQSTVSIFKLLY